MPEVLCVEGSLQITIEPDFVVDAGLLKGLKEFKMAVSMTPSAELAVIAEAEVLKKEYTLDLPLKLSFAPIVVGPVVIVPEFTPQLRVTASASAAFKPRVTVGFHMTGGAHYKKDYGWTPIGEYEPMFDAAIGTVSFGLSADIKAAVIAKFATKLYGVAGPLVAAGPYVEVEVFTLPPRGECSWDYGLYYGADAGFGGEFKLLGWGWEYTATLLDFRFSVDKHREDCDAVDGSPPGAPSQLAFSNLSDNSLTLTWNASTDDSGYPVSYEVVRNWETSNSSRILYFYDVGQPVLHDTGLRDNTEYCYTVTAIDMAGNGSMPSPLACTRTASRDTEPPSRPSGVRLEALSPSTISVSWEASTDNMTVDRYMVFEWPESDTDPTAVTRTEGLWADITGLNPGTEYCFGVSAVDEAGNFSDVSNMVCATTLEASAAAWRFLIACSGRDYIFEEPFDLVEDRVASVISVTAEGNDYDGDPLTYALTGTYTSQDMILDGRIDWSFEFGGRRVDTFMADLSTDDTGNIPMDIVFHSTSGCDAVIRFIMGRGNQGSSARTVVTSSSAVSFSGATISGH